MAHLYPFPKSYAHTNLSPQSSYRSYTPPAPRWEKNSTSPFKLLMQELCSPTWVSQRSLHNAPIFRLLLKVAVNGTHQCDFPNFCGQQCPTKKHYECYVFVWTMCVSVCAFVCMGMCGGGGGGGVESGYNYWVTQRKSSRPCLA